MVNRYQVLAVGVLVESIGGLMYAFGLYSDEIKSRFALSQSEVDFIGTAVNLGSTVGLDVGLLFDWGGPAWTLGLAGILGVVGWLPVWFALNTSWRPPYGLLVLFAVFQGHSMMASDVTTVGTAGYNFPANRGSAISVCKAFVGLSGALLAQVYQGFFAPNVAPLLLYIAIDVGIICVLGAIFTRRIPGASTVATPREAKETAHILKLTLGLIVSLAFLLLVNALVRQYLYMNETAGQLLCISALALFATVVAYLGTRRESAYEDAERRPLINSAATEPIPADPAIPAPHHFTLLEALKTPEFYMLLTCYMVGGSCSLLLINNLGQIVPSLGGSKNDQAVYVSIVSVCNCLGRLLSGFVGDVLLRKYQLPRPAVWTGATALSVMGFLLMLIPNLNALYGGVFFVGLSYGAYNALTPTLVVELFGCTNFASIYTTGSLGLALGSYLMATKLAAAVYDKHAPAGSTSCVGIDCFRTSYLICIGLVSLSVVVSFALAKRSKRRYLQLYPPISGKII